jgi:osmotically-inducible protein OsmY
MAFRVHFQRILWELLSLNTCVVLGTAGCRGDMAARDDPKQDAAQEIQIETSPRPSPEITAIDPESEMDQAIRRQLTEAIVQDPVLKDRDITLKIENGNVRATGDVQSETERRRINDLAMAVAGVKSIANALRVSDGSPLPAPQ